MENGLLFIQGVVSQMHESSSDEELLNMVIDKCIELTGATSGTLMIISADGYLDITVTRGFTEDIKKDFRFKTGEGITGWVAKNRKPYLCADTSGDKIYVPIKNDIHSELAVPMITLNKVIGVINLDSRKKGAFKDVRIETLIILANIAAQIHNKISIIEHLEIKVLYQNILLNVAEILNDAGSLRDKFQLIMGILQKELLMTRGTIVLRIQDTDKYQIITSVGLTDEEIKKGVYSPGEGITGKIIQNGEAVAIKNIFTEPDFLNKTRARRIDKTGSLSFIGVPVMIKNDVVGVISVDKPFEGKKFDEDILLLKIITSFLGQAIQVDTYANEEKERLLKENAFLREEVQSHYSFDQLIGISPAMLDIYKKIELVAGSEATVLITGESGTGKELVADSIYNRSKRLNRPFVKINCSAIPETLLESELFGFKKGSFTGASNDKKGRFVMADKGTIFLDEIGDMPLSMQTKLLRVIQNREVDVIGGSVPLAIDVRIIAATSRNLEIMIKEGKFREDLYYRLNVFRIDIPPLRDRKADIEMISRGYLKKIAERESVEFSGITYDAMERLTKLKLYGNVRELENYLEQAFLISGKGKIDVFHLNLPKDKKENDEKDQLRDVSLSNQFAGDFDADEGNIYKNVISEMEKKLIKWALDKTVGNRSEAARILGINRNTLNSKIQ
ncbi:MAG: sigma 54-interacting transcriptional regulator [Spirochaetes bacterium]|nr:sigma 54-interacting transcriptional regulator [Spirochaetota bacterium]